ncbi:MAG: peptidoglycan-binding protein [Polyangiaceae bacterium]|nr:peptidoglycan-binding protein [Polyangiaceae bacterium]
MRVARTQKDLPHKNTLVLRKLKVYFQRFPGKGGTDADRAINDVEYILRAGGRVIDKGKTAADGSIEMIVPTGVPIELEVFGTKYDVKVHPFMEAENTAKGAQRRLSMLGYELGNPDGNVGEKTDRATLNFQADQSLEPDGVFGSNTESKLKSEFGE